MCLLALRHKNQRIQMLLSKNPQGHPQLRCQIWWISNLFKTSNLFLSKNNDHLVSIFDPNTCFFATPTKLFLWQNFMWWIHNNDNGSFTIGSKNDITNQIGQSLYDQANHSSNNLTQPQHRKGSSQDTHAQTTVATILKPRRSNQPRQRPLYLEDFVGATKTHKPMNFDEDV